MSEKQLGIFRVSYELIGELLSIPKEHKIIDVICGRDDRHAQVFSVVVSGDKMTKTYEGNQIVYLNNPRIGRELIDEWKKEEGNERKSL